MRRAHLAQEPKRLATTALPIRGKEKPKCLKFIWVLTHQLQALASELKSSFTEAMQELSRIQHGEYALEEKVQSCRVQWRKNCYFFQKEELNDAKSMIEEISAKQEEMQQKIEQLQQEKRKESRKLKVKRIQKEEHGSQTVPTPLQGSPFRALKLPEPVLINEDFVKLLHNATYEKGIVLLAYISCSIIIFVGQAVTSTNLDREENFTVSSSGNAPSKGQASSTIWKQAKDSKERNDEHILKNLSDRTCLKTSGMIMCINLANQNYLCSVIAKRQNIALDLLESERKYVVSLSLILKVKSTLQGTEVKRNTKESFFPNSLRYLVQQHVELLHALQERVLSWPQQGILGDIFLRLTNDENSFLDYYIAYLRDLPEYISLIHVVILKKEETKSDLYLFFFHIVQRIPEYLLHLQNILKYTEQEHPDYYLLLVCVQRLRVFISHYSLLFQCNEDLLIQKRKKLREVSLISSFIKLYKGLATQCPSSGQAASPTPSATSFHNSGIHSEETVHLFPSPSTLPRHLMSHIKKGQQEMANIPGKPCEWEADGRKHGRPESALIPSQFNEEDLKALAASLQPVPDTEFNAASSDMKENLEKPHKATVELLQDSRSFTPDFEDFEYQGNTYSIPGLYEKEPLAILQTCSPASSESSIDICFLRPVNFTKEPEKAQRTLQLLPKSSDLEHIGSSTSKREAFRSKGKQLSQSLKEFPRSGSEGISTRLYSTRSSSGSRLSNLPERGFQPHEASATSRSSHWNYFPPQRGVGEKQSFVEDMHLEDIRFSCRDDNEQTSFSSHPPRQEQKRSFRSSFRKLFKKK
uniref:Rho guanine nucleotide exchange factor 33 n=1 Tax=Naja naja TaxID=35670 RepID=A0A8C6V8W8_NAJNA